MIRGGSVLCLASLAVGYVVCLSRGAVFSAIWWAAAFALALWLTNHKIGRAHV